MAVTAYDPETVAVGDRYDPRTLVTLVRTWEDAQRQRIRDELRVRAVERFGGEVPEVLLAHIDGLKAGEKELSNALARELRKHPLAPWIAAQHNFGEHSAAIILGLLDGDPYVAFPKVWVEGKGERKDGVPKKRELVQLEPRPRTVSQLWSYCGLNPERPRRKEAMSQADLMARGKPFLGARVRLAAESVGQRARGCDACYRERLARAIGETKPTERTPARANEATNPNRSAPAWAPPPPDCTCAEEWPWRHLYDRLRLHYQDAVHERPCRGRGTCGLEVGTPWREGHKRQAAVNQVAKELLLGMWVEAKRLREDGVW